MTTTLEHGAAYRDLEADDQARWRILEMIAQNEPLECTLERIVALLESRCRGVRAAVLLLRDGKFYRAASPNLPEAFSRGLDGLAIDAPSGGEATPCPYWSTTRTVASIAEDPRWSSLRELALENGLRTCWSEPVISPAGEVLGVVNCYLGDSRPPDAGESSAFEVAGHLAGIAVEQRNLVADLWHQAHFDPVTRLPNRYMHADALERAMEGASRNGSRFGILYVDIDRFQTINDLLGRQTGDLVLEQVARRIEKTIRSGDQLARGLGDEFTVLLHDVSQTDEITMVAERIRRGLFEPFAIQGHELTVTATIGCAIYPEHGAGTDALEQSAENAMHHAKRRARNSVQVYQQEMSTYTHQRVLIESSLGGALARRELQIVYQPQFDLRGGSLVGAEALLRWKHPVIGTVAPATFIPIAEETGLIVPIGLWVLNEVCRQAVLWRSLFGKPSRVAVNVSPVQFARENFVDIVAAVLKESRLPAEALELELTESTLVRDTAAASERMQALTEFGVRISMDDFGTGYSSLSYLSTLPFASIKIDRSFIAPITAASERPPLIESIVSVCRNLGKDVVAEGIETAAQRDALASLGCHIGQGFFFGAPSDPETFGSTWIPHADPQ